MREVVFSALFRFSLLLKYPTFGQKKEEEEEEEGIHGEPEVSGSLANHRSLVFAKKKSESSDRNLLEHCRDGGANYLFTTTPVSCVAQRHIGDGGHPCSTLW